jgi:hypothetical protein
MQYCDCRRQDNFGKSQEGKRLTAFCTYLIITGLIQLHPHQAHAVHCQRVIFICYFIKMQTKVKHVHALNSLFRATNPA